MCEVYTIGSVLTKFQRIEKSDNYMKHNNKNKNNVRMTIGNPFRVQQAEEATS